MNMKRLTKIEQLDQRIPGLAENVKRWFSQGVSSEQVAVLIFKHYQVSLTSSPVSSFRTRRWVPEQELLEEKKIAALAALEVAREEAIRASMASQVPGVAK
jgi:hypothetical protein